MNYKNSYLAETFIKNFIWTLKDNNIFDSFKTQFPKRTSALNTYSKKRGRLHSPSQILINTRESILSSPSFLQSLKNEGSSEFFISLPRTKNWEMRATTFLIGVFFAEACKFGFSWNQRRSFCKNCNRLGSVTDAIWTVKI